MLSHSSVRSLFSPLPPPLHSTRSSGSSSSLAPLTGPSILVHNNHLSCSLPREPRPYHLSLSDYHGNNQCGINSYPNCLVPAPTFGKPHGTCGERVTVRKGCNLCKSRRTTTNSLFLAGNLFSTASAATPSAEDIAGGVQRARLPAWLGDSMHGDPMANGAPFLYLRKGTWVHVLSSFTVPVAYLVLGALALALATHGLTWRARTRLDPPPRGVSFEDNRPFDESINMHERTGTLHDLFIRGMACWSVPLVLVMMPLYIAGAKYYECGDALVKTTSAYLADAVEIEGVVAVALILVALFSVVCLALFRTKFSDAVIHTGRRQQQHENQQDDGNNDDDDGHHHHHHDADERRASAPTGNMGANNEADPLDTTLTTHPRCHPILLFLLWAASLVLLSFPSFIYGLTSSVPTRDSIYGDEFAFVAATVYWAAPIIITLINSVVVPVVVKYCCDRSTWQSARLLLVSRLVTTWLVPVVVEVLFSNSCGRMWLSLWSRCESAERMQELDILGPSGDVIYELEATCNIVNETRYSNGYIPATVLVSGADICNPSAGGVHQQYAQCGRAVVEAMAPLLVGKMALAALVLPALTIFRWRVAPAGWKDCLHGLVKRCYRCCGGGGGGGGVGGGRDSDSGSDSDDEGLAQRTKGLRLDDVVAQSLTWLDVAIVFGPHIPLLVPLVLVSLVTTRWAHEAVGLRRLGLREERAEFSKPSTWYVLFSIVCQQVLTVAVFVGIDDKEKANGSFRVDDMGRIWFISVTVILVAGVAVMAVLVRWLEAAGRRCCGPMCRKDDDGDGAAGRRRTRGGTTELSNRLLLGGGALGA